MYKKSKIFLAMLTVVCIAQEAQSSGEFLGLLRGRLSSKLATAAGIRHYGTNHFVFDQIPVQGTIRKFSSIPQPTNLLESPEVREAIITINGNCLKEIAARGDNDFVCKSYKVVALLKESLKRGSSIDGQGGLADAEADWISAWERLTKETQKSLRLPHDKIQSLVDITNKHLYGIDQSYVF